MLNDENALVERSLKEHSLKKKRVFTAVELGFSLAPARERIIISFLIPDTGKKIANSAEKSSVSATEVRFRGNTPPAVSRPLEPLPNRYKGMPLSVSMAPENDSSNLTDVYEK